MMNKKDYLFIGLFALIGWVSRLPFIEQMQSHWDGPQYSIAILRYSLFQETPAPPGYPLYIAIGWVWNLMVNDPHKALLFESVLFSGIGAVVMYVAGKIIFSRFVGIIAAILFLSGPAFYYFGLTAYAYGILPVIVTILALIVYVIVIHRRQLSIPLAGIVAFAIGFRPQELLFLIPLILYAVWHLTPKERKTFLLASIVLNLLWLLPFLFVVGGPIAYYKASTAFANTAIAAFTVQTVLAHIERMIKGYFLALGIAGTGMLYYVSFLFRGSIVKEVLKNRIVHVFSLWILPSLLFNLFVRSDHAGYQMSYLAACTLLIAYAVWMLFRRNQLVISILLVFVVVFNLYWFFHSRDPYYKESYVPTSFHYSEIVKNDMRMSAKIAFINKNYSSDNTILITNPNAWRPYMYYLKTYRVYNIDALFTREEQFKYIIRMGRQWDFVQKQEKSMTFTIPPNIQYVIFVDDQAEQWMIENKTVYVFPANSSISVLQVQPNERYTYGFETFIKL